ncbi:MAG: iron ABC transporter permease [Planctomycetota bacterium]
MLRRPVLREEHAWRIAVGLAASVVAIPIAVVLLTASGQTEGVWAHLWQTRLAGYATNSALLAMVSCSVAFLLGIVPAWLLTSHRVPGAPVLERMMLLPLAVPPYVCAYAYSDLLQFSGPLQSGLRDATGWSRGEYWFPEVRSVWGAGLILAVSLTPYVFVAARQAFAAQASYSLVVARTLGASRAKRLLGIALPLARPAILGGVLLVFLETIADFGVADYCAVDTLTTGIYRSWYGLDSPPTAARISVLLLAGIAGVVFLASLLRRGSDTTESAAAEPPRRTGLGHTRGVLAAAACFMPIVLGFVLPTAVFAKLLMSSSLRLGFDYVVEAGQNSLLIGFLAAMGAVILAVVVVTAKRACRSPIVTATSRIALLGYGVPGPVIAVGLLVPLTMLDRWINHAASFLLGSDGRPGLILTGSIFAVLLGCQTRFLAVAASTVNASFGRVRASLDHAARTLGAGPLSTLLRIHLPVCAPGLIAAMFLVFADVVKELPMTLMLRPFNFDTLAVRTYQLVHDERLEEASASALAMIITGLVPVVLVSALATNRRKLARGISHE